MRRRSFVRTMAFALAATALPEISFPESRAMPEVENLTALIHDIFTSAVMASVQKTSPMSTMFADHPCPGSALVFPVSLR